MIKKPKLAKQNSLKRNPLFLKVQCHSRLSILVPPESPSAVFVIYKQQIFCLFATIFTLDETVFIVFHYFSALVSKTTM